MERFAHFEDELAKYIGCHVSEDVLLGRNYFYIEDQKVKKDICLSELSDFDLYDSIDYKSFYESGEVDEEDDEITCTKVKAYLASMSTKSAWIKCMAPHPDDVEVGTAYIIIQVILDEDSKIESVHAFTRFMDGMNGGFGGAGFFVDIPGSESMECHLSHMPMFPPEVLAELDMLTEGRYFKKGFSFVGKPLPENIMWMNGGDNCKTSAQSSAFRNAYFHISVDVTDDDIIDGFEFSQYENEHSMFQRPRSVDEDIVDGLDCALMLIDAYTKEEYDSL